MYRGYSVYCMYRVYSMYSVYCTVCTFVQCVLYELYLPMQYKVPLDPFTQEDLVDLEQVVESSDKKIEHYLRNN